MLLEQAARLLLGLRADPVAKKRVSWLAEKCNEGTLSSQERQRWGRHFMWRGPVLRGRTARPCGVPRIAYK